MPNKVIAQPHVDPIFKHAEIFDYPFSLEIWQAKYSNNGKDSTYVNTFRRVADAIAGVEKIGDRVQWANIFYEYMMSGLFMPAGRILAGAGSENLVTLVNCFVNETVEDSMTGIMDALSKTAFTMQQGGGMGTDFSTIRPSGAYLKRTGSEASGPLPFMDMWHTMCATIMSAGSRRGAMMGTMICTHPDLLNFIEAKHQAGRMTNFNVSILVTEKFVKAVAEDKDWCLHFPTIPVGERPVELVTGDFIDNYDVKQYVYSKHKARDIWEKILQSTYEYSEPGVIFIDRVNAMNNLQYCETISCTNPCVIGSTPILTKDGYLPIESRVDLNTEVWNGSEWSTVVPFKTGVNELLRVHFSNGMHLNVTPYHGFYVNKVKKEAQALVVGDKLDWSEMPIIDLPTLGGYTYSQGFYAGDGVVDDNHSKLYNTKYMCQSRLQGSFSVEHSDRGTYKNWFHGNMLPKQDVPVNGSITECVEWFAGLLDADGCLETKRESFVLTISSKEKSFLQDIVLMLTRLGCNPRMWEGADGGPKIVKGIAAEFKNTFRLMINAKDAFQLTELGLKCERISTARFTKPQGIARIGQRVVKIETLTERQETFCFTEPMKNMGVFNGILGANCGEQPLPPYGACNLGAVNLALMVKKPFQEDAYIDFNMLEQTVVVAHRFLDNVIDVSGYPLEEQRQEQQDKRRIGLGISGLADMFILMGISYGSAESISLADSVMDFIAETTYMASVELAREKTSFGKYSPEVLESRFIQDRSKVVHKAIESYGLRNGVLLTIAPTGTTSIFYGNISSGMEPNFAFEYDRNVKQKDDSMATHHVESFVKRLWDSLPSQLPKVFVEGAWIKATTLSVTEHVMMQATLQKHVDASISKTINIPEGMPYEEFKHVYKLAYDLGLKGITTYRPSATRGSVLMESKVEPIDEPISESVSEPEPMVIKVAEPIMFGPQKRADRLQGETFKIKWPSFRSAIYMVVNHDKGRLAEVFFNSKDSRYQEWTTALSLSMTALFRLQRDNSFIFKEFQQITSSESAWFDGKRFDSIHAYIGYLLANYAEEVKVNTGAVISVPIAVPMAADLKTEESVLDWCPECEERQYDHSTGCPVCRSCGYTKC